MHWPLSPVVATPRLLDGGASCDAAAGLGKESGGVVNNEEKALRIYDLLREAHKSVQAIWHEFPELIASDGICGPWEIAIDAVDNTLYLAEGFFVQASHEAFNANE